MKAKGKRYFGMTVVQLAILGCLALTAFGVIGGGFWFVNSSMMELNDLLSPPVNGETTPQATLEPAPTATLAPTPTQTPVPYESLIPDGWSQHKNQSIEIWLPSSFYETNIDVSVSELIEKYRELGQDKLANELENSPPGYVFWLETQSPSQKLFNSIVYLSYVDGRG